MQARRAANLLLRRRCNRLLAAVLLVTFVVHAGVTQGFSTRRLATGTQFDDFESFGRYMSVDVPASIYGPTITAPLASAVDRVVDDLDINTGEPQRIYYDADGNVISEEQALTRQIKNREGAVLYEYVHRNSSVISISYGAKNALPITVYTAGDLYAGQQRLFRLNVIFGVLYLLEILLTGIYFAVKRVR